MALNQNLDTDLDDLQALLRQAAAELRATRPELFEEPQPYTDEEYAQIVADGRDRAHLG